MPRSNRRQRTPPKPPQSESHLPVPKVLCLYILICLANAQPFRSLGWGRVGKPPRVASLQGQQLLGKGAVTEPGGPPSHPTRGNITT